MALQFRRGTEVERDQETFIPLAGEPVYTTDSKRLYIGDGQTVGGNPVGFNNNLSDLTDIELGYERIIPIISISATDNIVHVTTSGPHGLLTGDEIYLSTTTQPSLNGIHEITATGITSITFTQSVADFPVTTDSGALKFEPTDRSILAYNQQSGKWIEQTYVYKLEDLGDVQLSSPADEQIIQYTSIPIGNIIDIDENIVEAGVQEPASIPEGLTWVETDSIQKFVNKTFEIGVENLTNVVINESALKNNQILAYNSFLEVWTNRDYVDELTDLADVGLTPLPDLTETQARVTITGSYAEEDRLDVQVAGTIYTRTVTIDDVNLVASQAGTDAQFDLLLRAILGNAIADQINANEDAPVVASFANDIITLNPKEESVNINLIVTVLDNDPGDGFTPGAIQFEPINRQILSYDGEKWTNKALEINNFNLSDLNDVDLDNVADGQILQYSSISGTWRNQENFITLSQFADVEIANPGQGKALIYDENEEKFVTRSFILDDLLDVEDPSFTQIIPDGSVLAYDEAEQAWTPQQFSSLSSRTEITFYSGPLENLDITTVDFEAFTGYALFKIKASAPCTVTFYVSDYERDADLDRAENENPGVGQGIFAELSPFDTSWRRIAPVIYGFNDDTPITRMAYVKIRNRSGYYQSNIEIKIVALQIEEDPEQAAAPPATP